MRACLDSEGMACELQVAVYMLIGVALCRRFHIHDPDNSIRSLLYHVNPSDQRTHAFAEGLPMFWLALLPHDEQWNSCLLPHDKARGPSHA